MLRINDMLSRIKGAYLEVPHLQLTPRQAQRLWGFDADVTEAILTALVDVGFLRRTRDGTFVRWGTGMRQAFR